MNKSDRDKILTILKDHYGHEQSGLNFNTPFELLIATILSAQCTDVRVNIVTEKLFDEFNTPQKILSLGAAGLKEKIKTCGLANTKTKNILLTCQKLIEDYDGMVPEDMPALLALPGVGRKTANVVRSNAFDIPAIAVDTHVFRVSRRIGLAKGKTVLEVEKELMQSLPKDKWSPAHHWLIWHGRRLCLARNPKCHDCPLVTFCKEGKKTIDSN